MTKLLSGKDLAGYVKERQAHTVKALKSQKIHPKLLILRDSNNPVIQKYVSLKQAYGADIGVDVQDLLATSETDLIQKIKAANQNPEISGLIVQLPLETVKNTSQNLTSNASEASNQPQSTKAAERQHLQQILSQIAPEKDLDGLSGQGNFDSATATAILWLLSAYDISLDGQKIAVVGRGLLVGAPLYKMLKNSNQDVTLFHRGSNLAELKNYDLIITATGVPGLITSDMVKTGATIVDAGTASEKGILKGDLADPVRTRTDLHALTPRIGGVGPLTVSVLFENLLTAAQKSAVQK